MNEIIFAAGCFPIQIDFEDVIVGPEINHDPLGITIGT